LKRNTIFLVLRSDFSSLSLLFLVTAFFSLFFFLGKFFRLSVSSSPLLVKFALSSVSSCSEGCFSYPSLLTSLRSDFRVPFFRVSNLDSFPQSRCCVCPPQKVLNLLLFMVIPRILCLPLSEVLFRPNPYAWYARRSVPPPHCMEEL